MSQNINTEIDISKVEISLLINGTGLLAKKNIEKGEVVFVERSEVFHELTSADFSNPACDACFLVRKIIQDPQTAKFYNEFDLDSSCVHANKPSKDDKKFLKKLSKKSKVPYEKVLDIWKIVCAYHVKGVLATPINQKIRVQLSRLFNRTNHSCNPNTTVIHIFSLESDFYSRLLTVKATRQIQKGEEITFSYIDPQLASTLDFNSRREELKSSYGFICNCEKCLEESKTPLHHS
ncbi:MAG: hypothetical protein ACI88H_001045 [Cocleimonas sp.]|jgi:hypothetical protein